MEKKVMKLFLMNVSRVGILSSFTLKIPGFAGSSDLKPSFLLRAIAILLSTGCFYLPAANAQDMVFQGITEQTTHSEVPADLLPLVLEEQGLLSDACTDYIWFKKGASMTFEGKDGKGKNVYQSKMNVINVTTKGDVTIGEVQMTDDKKNEFTMEFKCTDDKLYMDFASAIKQAMAKSSPEAPTDAVDNLEMNFSDGFMSFPKNMQPGQDLDDATFTMKTNSGGMGMQMTSSVVNRKVVAKESVTTPAGTFDCVKVTGTRKTTARILGKDRNMGKPLVETVWFAPGIGTVKQENYTENGKLESTNQLIEFKM